MTTCMRQRDGKYGYIRDCTWSYCEDCIRSCHLLSGVKVGATTGALAGLTPPPPPVHKKSQKYT